MISLSLVIGLHILHQDYRLFASRRKPENMQTFLRVLVALTSVGIRLGKLNLVL